MAFKSKVNEPQQPNTGNLPIPVSSFVGRAHEIAHIQGLVSSARLVTLTGVGGSGKTRLAIQVAKELRNSFGDGAWWVNLGPLENEIFVPQAIAQSLGVSDTPTLPLIQTLVNFLRNKQLLLVLDNCEHLIQACSKVCHALLAESSQLSILTTSRQALHMSGEQVFAVPTLATPKERVITSVSMALEYESIKLFVERAKSVSAHFVLGEENVRTVSQICRALDGIPLAIELAAAWCNVLTVHEIAARLDDRFNFLTLGSQNALPQQQALRTTLDWSLALVSTQERILLRRLAVFAGTFELEAVKAVCADVRLKPEQILKSLARLVAHSLILVENSGIHSQYRMLDTIRMYAMEKLERAKESDAFHIRHVEYYLALAEEAENEIHGPQQMDWLTRLDGANENLRAALDWCLDETKSDVPFCAQAGLRMAGALHPFWDSRNSWNEARVWYERALALRTANTASARAARAKALVGAAWLALWQHDWSRTTPFAEECLKLYQELEDARGIGVALAILAFDSAKHENYDHATALLEQSEVLLRSSGGTHWLAWVLDLLGYAALRQGNYSRAIELLKQELEQSRKAGDLVGIANALTGLASVHEYQRDYDDALSLIDESLKLFQKLGRKVGIAIAMAQMADIAICQRNYARATELAYEAQILFQELGQQGSNSWVIQLLGLAACGIGEYEQAVGYFAQGLAIHLEENYEQGIAENLGGFGGVALGLGQLERAARLFGAVDAWLATAGAALGPADDAEYRRNVATLRVRFKTTQLDRAWAAGRTMTR